MLFYISLPSWSKIMYYGRSGKILSLEQITESKSLATPGLGHVFTTML
jgi:hypothetical protein